MAEENEIHIRGMNTAAQTEKMVRGGTAAGVALPF